MKTIWLILVISLPGRSATPRMRIWRALKSAGAGILRDGVYILPLTADHQALFARQADEVRALQGTAYILIHSPDPKQKNCESFVTLFDRSSEYADWNERAAMLKNHMHEMDEPRARREEAQLRRDLESIVRIDFFPDAGDRNAQQAMSDISAALNRHFSPGEPTVHEGTIEIKARSQFRNRTWATRANLWVDRVASAWLIRRRIDPKAQFLWLEKPQDCPSDAVGFDFDGAQFSHIERFVTFEVLLKSFALEADAALIKIGELVHYLDVGGVAVAESEGFIALLAGAKQRSKNDDGFAKRAFALLDNLYAAYSETKAGDS